MKYRYFNFLWILSICLLSSCVTQSGFKIDKKFALRSINNEIEFSHLASAPESATLARTQTLKFMVDRKSHRELWFFDTRKYTYHFAFAHDHLSSSAHPVIDHQTFNRREYSSDKRRFEMGSIVYYQDQNIWTLQLIAGDTLDAQEILRLFKQVKANLWIGSMLRFLPMSSEQEQAVSKIADQLPVVTSDEVFKGIQYQPLTQGRAVGYLRFIKGPLDIASVKPDQILVLETLPEEIPVSAAVISQQLQTPLAHIALLCGSRRTPNMALRNVFNDPGMRSLDGKLVELDVNPQQYSLRPASSEMINAFNNKSHVKKLQVPKLNLAEHRLLDISALDLNSVAIAGAKASQLAEVSKIDSTINTPGGFVVPVAYYFNQLNESGASQLVSNLVSNNVNNTNDNASRLAELRKVIEGFPVEKNLLANIRHKMAEQPTQRWILRSSTNAEDLAGFTGAGLYRSVKVNSNATDIELAAALRSVWSSVWLQTAFEERQWFGVDHQAVGMAILVQPFVADIYASGVAITANPFAGFRPGVFINAQPVGSAVTGAAGDDIAEQHLVYTFGEQLEFELLSKSSRVNGDQIILNKHVLGQLTEQLVKIHKHFLQRWGGEENAVDVEFLVANDNKIIILQARPYRVSYTNGQRNY